MIIKEFTFEKKDGTIRTIKGTDDWKSFYELHPEKKPKSKNTKSNYLKTIYDLDDDTFKTLIRSKFISQRIVGVKTVRVRIKDADFYHHPGTISYLMKRKTPYFILSMLNTKQMSRNELTNELSEISKKVKIAKNQKRNVRRLLRAFDMNSLIKKENDKYTITQKGKEFLQNNVI